VSASFIAVKIADGRFAPVLNTETPHRHRRLVLTTVHDNQTQMQIDLYRAEDQDFEDARYLGSLVVEDITPENRGEPEIALTLHYDVEGNLVATAKDMKKGSYQSLSVNIETLSEADTYDVADFQLDELEDVSFDSEGENDLEQPEFATAAATRSASADELSGRLEPQRQARSGNTPAEASKGSGFSPVLYFSFMVLALTLVGVLAFLIFRVFEGEPLPPLENERAALLFPFLFASWRSLITKRCRNS